MKISIRVRLGVVLGVLLSLTMAVSPATVKQAEWTVLVYVQANNNLAPWAHKNFSDMAECGSNENLNILVQWYQPGQKTAARYRVEKGRMVLDTQLAEQTDGNSASDLVDAMRWAVAKYPAKQYALILWDHGVGIIDPVWGKMGSNKGKREAFEIDAEMLVQNPRIQIGDLTVQAVDAVCDGVEYVCQQVIDFCQHLIGVSNTVETAVQNADANQDGLISNTEAVNALAEITSELALQIAQEQALQQLGSRAILFNESSRTYMDNQTLIAALSTIKDQLLGGKKIDILGMDACLMAGLEMGHQIRSYVDYFVASQEVELAHGWVYTPLMKALSAPNASARNVASLIVKTYGDYYQDKVSFYTQSAVDLAKLEAVSNNFGSILQKLRLCAAADRNALVQLLQKSRRSCVQFSAFGYIDLHSWYEELEAACASHVGSGLNAHSAELKLLLAQGKRLITEAVISNVAGKSLARAKGLSLYYPLTKVDESYGRTSFAQENQWNRFLTELGIAG